MNEPGKALKARRELAGLSQQDLAVIVEMHAASIGQIERGIQSPPRGTVAALDKALGAGGELLAEFGYVSGELVSRLADLEARFEKLERGVREMGLMARGELLDLPLPDEPTHVDDAKPASRRRTRRANKSG